jgi:hypothetical protein
MMTTARFGLEGSAACREEGTAHPAPLYLRGKEYYSDRFKPFILDRAAEIDRVYITVVNIIHDIVANTRYCSTR